MTTRRAAIVAPMRTPVGTFGGSLRDVPVEDLAATAVKAVLDRTGIDPELIDDVIPVDDDEALTMARRLAREEGLLAGISCGAAMVGTLQVARELSKRGERAVIVTVFPDAGDKYLSEDRVWKEDL